MAVINHELPTMLDHVRRLDPNGAVAAIAEVLMKRNAFLEDAVVLEGNLPTGHRFTSRTALPSVAWRRFNEGVAPSKSATAQVDETCGMLEGFSVVDTELAKLNGNEAAFRASEDRPFIQALNHEIETGIIYHSTKTAPEKFLGLSPRLDSTSGVAGDQIVLGAGGNSNANTSIWLVSWSPDTVFGITPKGFQAGIQQNDMGVQLWDDGTGKKFRAYVTNWVWKFGLVVKDWRYIARIPNIDVSTMDNTADILIPLMIEAAYRLPDLKTGRLAWYCNRRVMAILHNQARNAVKNSTLTIESIEGKPVLHCMGIPIRMTDSLINSEADVA